MQETKVQNEAFFCGKAQKKVGISYHLAALFDSDSQVSASAQLDFECNTKDKCGVAPSGSVPDWNKCIHPKAPKH
jgi:hypothetical protein